VLSLKKFILNAALGIGVLLVCVAFGYYVIGPRMEFTPEGKPRFNLSGKKSDEQGANPQRVELPPKVDVYEKLPSSVTNSAGDNYRTDRQVAPYDYSGQDKKTDKPKRNSDKTKPDEHQAGPPDEAVSPDNTELSIETPAHEPDPPIDEQEPPPAHEPPDKPDPEKEKPAEQPKSSSASYRVQVGIYLNRENANQVVQTLRSSGFQAAIVPFQRDGSTVYRVQVGVYKNKETADTVAKSVRDKGFEAYVSGGN
jgi:cell division protein FtsN